MLVPQLVVLVLSAVSPSAPGPAGPPFTPPEWVRAEAGAIRTAPKKLEAACEGGDSSACVDLAYLYATGTKVSADAKKAVKLARTACFEDSARGCAVFAWLFHDAPSLLQDPFASRAAYEIACARGHAPACFHAALALERGEALPAKEYDHARALFERSCNAGFEPACGRKGSTPAGSRAAHRGEPLATAEPGDETACTRPDRCVILGYEHSEEGPRRDLERAAHFFLLGCDQGHPYGCGVLAEFYEVGLGGFERNALRALDLYERACDRGWRIGCARVAKHYESSKVTGDDKIAVEYGTRACEAGELEGCEIAGHLLLTRDPPRGFSLVSQACDAGHVGSCTWKGVAFQQGWGTPKSLPRAIEVLRKACERARESGDASGCFFLGMALDESSDPKERDQAPAAFDAACKGGHEVACSWGKE